MYVCVHAYVYIVCTLPAARAEIWIEIYAPCATLFRLWDHNIGYQSQSQAWKLTLKVSK